MVVQNMEICKILRALIVLIFFTISSSVKSEINLLDRKVSAVDLILLKYEIFLTKNFNRLYKGGGIPQTIILYQYIDSTVKYTDENGFFVNIYAYMDKKRYTSEKKYDEERNLVLYDHFKKGAEITKGKLFCLWEPILKDSIK